MHKDYLVPFTEEYYLSYHSHIERQGTPIRADPKIRTFSKASCETMGQFPGVQRPGPFSWGPEKLKDP